MAGVTGRIRTEWGRRAAINSRVSGNAGEAQARPWLRTNLSNSSRLPTPSLS